MSMTGYTSFSATVSGSYRYELRRCWDPGKTPVLFVGLNPSTADGNSDDHTIQRCRYYAQRWGYGGLMMGNLYGLRSTYPHNLERHFSEITNSTVPDVVGSETDRFLRRMVKDAGLIVACWGASKHADPSRVDAVTAILLEHWSRTIWCLGETRAGHPRHPSRLANDVELVVWRQKDGLTPSEAGSPINDEESTEARALALLAERENATVPPETHPYDVCNACGHLRKNHVSSIGGRDTCKCFIPWERPGATKTLPSLRELSPVEYATELPLRSKAGGSPKEWSSSICPCSGFEPSGLRFQPEDDQDGRDAVRRGARRRTLIEI